MHVFSPTHVTYCTYMLEMVRDMLGVTALTCFYLRYMLKTKYMFSTPYMFVYEGTC
jgi:hypothetical protein